MKDIINNATKGKFTEFSDSIRTELTNKLSNHEISRNYANEYDNIQVMKKVFADANALTNKE